MIAGRVSPGRDAKSWSDSPGSFRESSEMKDIYDGLVTLDSNGEMEVAVRAWFEALSSELRCQLTALGGRAPNLHVAQAFRRPVRDCRRPIGPGNMLAGDRCKN
jgi:hypothetical protein